MRIGELVKTYRFDNLKIVGNEDDELCFVVEIYKMNHSNIFYPIVFSLDHFRLFPTFQDYDNKRIDLSFSLSHKPNSLKISDEALLCEEESFGFDEVKGTTIDDALKQVVSILTNKGIIIDNL